MRIVYAHMRSKGARQRKSPPRGAGPGTPARRAVNLRVDAILLDRAKALEINLSRLLERELERELGRQSAGAWLSENRDAIDTYNQRVEARGTFSDRLRRF